MKTNAWKERRFRLISTTHLRHATIKLPRPYNQSCYSLDKFPRPKLEECTDLL
jgi:hypothetical protein